MPAYDAGFISISLEAIGIVTLITICTDTIWNFLQTVRALLEPYFLLQEPQTLARKFGSWALITGSTDGIGKAYAKELACRGINLVLVSRTEEKLKSTAKEIEEEFSVKTKIICADFSTGIKAIELVKEALKDMPHIGILVNNVGKQYSYPMYLGEVPEQDLWDIININICAATMMTRLLVPGMKEQGRGAIVNISSAAECQPLPLMNVYAASKVYIKHFTQALREEYSKDGITVQQISPFFVNTKMNHFSDRLQEKSLFIPNATTYAKYAVSALGQVDHSTGYWAHGIQYFLTCIPPIWLRMKIGGKMTGVLRQDYLEQQEKKERMASNG